jgi:hypothetical protein
VSPFDWRKSPSEIVDALKPHRMARTQSQLKPRRLYTIKAAEQEILRDRHGGAYSKAAPKETPNAL